MAKLNTIKMKKGSLPIHYGWAAFSDFCENTGRDLNQIQDLESGMKPSDAIYLLHAGLKHGARKARKEFELSTDDVADMMDENPQLLPEAMKVFAQSFSQSSGQGEAGAIEKK